MLRCGIDVPEPVVFALPPGGRVAGHGAVHVQVFGAGPPLLLVPGLGCGAEVWATLVHRLCGLHELHVVTLAGFAGAAPVPAPLLPRWRGDLAAYVAALGTAVVLVGHSLGAYLVLELAAAHPERIAGVVAIDGVPAIAGLVEPGVSLAAAAEQQRREHEGLDAAAYTERWRARLRPMITAPAHAEALLPSVVRSDPATVGQAMAEILLADARAEVGRIAAPVLLVGALGGFATPRAQQARRAAYLRQFEAVPRCTAVFFDTARHFVMLDEPARLAATLVEFLAHRGR